MHDLEQSVLIEIAAMTPTGLGHASNRPKVAQSSESGSKMAEVYFFLRVVHRARQRGKLLRPAYSSTSRRVHVNCQRPAVPHLLSNHSATTTVHRLYQRFQRSRKPFNLFRNQLQPDSAEVDSSPLRHLPIGIPEALRRIEWLGFRSFSNVRLYVWDANAILFPLHSSGHKHY